MHRVAPDSSTVTIVLPRDCTKGQYSEVYALCQRLLIGSDWEVLRGFSPVVELWGRSTSFQEWMKAKISHICRRVTEDISA